MSLAPLLFTALGLLDAPAVDFARDVRPIFQARCASCHGPDKQQGGLRLDRKADALTGGGSGPAFEAGKAAESLMVSYVSGADPDMVMPPKGERLTPDQVATLRAWIDQGAPWPDGDEPAAAAKSAPDHWAFMPVRRPEVPAVSDPGWVKTPVDAFVLATLDAKGVKPSSEATRTTLIRRLNLDLLGLPPTPAEVEAFATDSRPDAYARLVDRLLASPHFGERWGRHWLDLARYADSDGYEKDSPRPNAFRYRDWVIQAVNRDLPFDAFTVAQIAGDLLPEADLWTRAATGFHRNTLTNKEGGVDQEEYRIKAVVDRVNTTGAVWLGLTVGCAQCHTHKYDPIAHKEYYGLFAFFNAQKEEDAPLASTEELAANAAALAKHEARRVALKARLDAAKEKPDVDRLTKALADHEKKKPTGPAAKLPVLVENPNPPKTHVLIRGDFLRKGPEVSAGTPAFLPPAQAGGSSLTRLDLARWLVAPDNPLTPRVAVNRVWGHLFGRALVTTIDDFGTKGERPSHPELLDWLAAEFPAQGWSLKGLIRTIVLSSTYRQSSDVRADLADRDPSNVWLARQSRLRLEAETLRDAGLAVSGLLAPRIGGPSVRPPQPPGISELTYAGGAKWVESQGPDRYRRGLYTWFQRTSPYPMLMTFDAPDANVCAVKRERSNTPLQALTLLNDRTFVECAQALGRRMGEEFAGGPSDRIVQGFRVAIGRTPSPEETDVLTRLHDRLPSDVAWTAVARTLLNLDEFVTRE